jgi:hypothetical protein
MTLSFFIVVLIVIMLSAVYAECHVFVIMLGIFTLNVFYTVFCLYTVMLRLHLGKIQMAKCQLS